MAKDWFPVGAPGEGLSYAPSLTSGAAGDPLRTLDCRHVSPSLCPHGHTHPGSSLYSYGFLSLISESVLFQCDLSLTNAMCKEHYF